MEQYSNDNDISDDPRHQDDRRLSNRRQEYDRRGVLRWDPVMKERRLGKDRRDQIVSRKQKPNTLQTRQ